MVARISARQIQNNFTCYSKHSAHTYIHYTYSTLAQQKITDNCIYALTFCIRSIALLFRSSESSSTETLLCCSSTLQMYGGGSPTKFLAIVDTDDEDEQTTNTLGFVVDGSTLFANEPSPGTLPSPASSCCGTRSLSAV